MTTYKTGNPLGSSAAKDLFDNAENLDFAVNSLTQTIWIDRLGKPRKSWFGMESAFLAQLASQEDRFNAFIERSGYQVIGDYADGPLTVTEYPVSSIPWLLLVTTQVAGGREYLLVLYLLLQ